MFCSWVIIAARNLMCLRMVSSACGTGPDVQSHLVRRESREGAVGLDIAFGNVEHCRLLSQPIVAPLAQKSIMLGEVVLHVGRWRHSSDQRHLVASNSKTRDLLDDFLSTSAFGNSVAIRVRCDSARARSLKA
ncbi:hypothetical protein B0H15DRAFT_401534 [Mycena belliarum]|uniref:Secreted protein n=1 Tax=Mycena belliarum TaxID=1033014 RepID=A0AAD6XJY9_9AGAR|nr:hypothetical protein B0H15DRAFT_401534 [Mycena belliae]